MVLPIDPTTVYEAAMFVLAALCAYGAMRSPRARPVGMTKYEPMSDATDTPQQLTDRHTDLLTITDAAKELGVSRRRVERLVQAGAVDTMRQERNGKAVHLIHRVVLPAIRAKLAAQPSGVPAGEPASLALTLLTERAEKAETERDDLRQERDELRVELAAVTNASGIRAWKLKRQIRQRLGPS